MNKIKTFLKNINQKLVRWYWLREEKLKTVNVHKATEKDLQKLGRKIGSDVSLDHNNTNPYLIDKSPKQKDTEPYLIGGKIYEVYKYGKEPQSPQSQPSTMQILRNKKTHRVVVCPGNLEKIKSMYNDDWEIVESAIKE
jgi:hypothetical protein